MKKIIHFALIVFAGMAIFSACTKSGTDGPINPPQPPPANADTVIISKKQMRAVWMATVWGLDWPVNQYDMAAQKKLYTDYLDKLKNLNMNAVFVQVKGMGDAFYNSPYEPWSASITGTRGKDPGYDVMKFMIDEAHTRGIEFHAWLNPFRIATRAGSSTPYPALHASVKPEWVTSHEKIQVYNPAVPEARQRLADIVKDIVSKYAVDGIHMDDYFYPDPSSAGTMVSDQPDFEKYGSGFTDIKAFRRANVDQAIKGVYDVIVSTKPEVVFSISPTSNFDYNLNTLYADIVKWAKEGWMDVVIPQIYQHSSFNTRLNDWDRFNNKPHLMVGHAIYFPESTPAQLSTEIDLTQKKKSVVGNLFYSAKYLNEKPELAAKFAEIFTRPAVIPFLGRAVAPAPASPQNLRLEGNTLKWSTSGNVRSVVYHTTDLKTESKVLAITTANELAVSTNGFYTVTAINADNMESKAAKYVTK